jgi:hypothetical protein
VILGLPGADGIPPNTSLLNPNAYFDSAPNVSPVWAAPNEGDIQGAINNSTVAEDMAMDYKPGQGYQMDHYTVFHQQTTNLAVLSFMQRLWGLAPLSPLNAGQNDLMSAFSFRQSPLPPPDVPVAPADTIGFHGSGGILTDISAPSPGSSLTINLEAETGGLSLDPSVNGAVSLTVTPPPGVASPPGFPTSVALASGQATCTVKFPTVGYYRIAAAGPDSSKGWVTVDVGVTPDTAP